MDIFIIVFVAMLLLVVAMSVGVLLGKKPISGSCGGMSALGMEVACDVCKGDKTKCDKEEGQSLNESLSYDASIK
ncbi:MAG: (Na+)-NQR maturation NqrM [Oleiphilus sp.]